jgi:hypothetical protein
VLARDTSADTPFLMSAPLAPPASAHSLNAGDHFAARAFSIDFACSHHCLSRCASHSRPREGSTIRCSHETPAPPALFSRAHPLPFQHVCTPRTRATTLPRVSSSGDCPSNHHCLSRCASHSSPGEGSASARQRHRRQHSSHHERTPCPISKCALPALRRPLRRTCIQQRLHQQPSRLVALCLAQPTRRGKRQCSQETLAPPSFFSQAHPLPFQQVRTPCTQVTTAPHVQQRLHQPPSLHVALCLAQPTPRGKRQCSQETPAPPSLSSRAPPLCRSSKCAFPALRRPLRRTCIQQRLHQQPSLLVALCRAPPTRRGKHQCSQEAPVPPSFFLSAHPLPFQQVRTPRTQATTSPHVSSSRGCTSTPPCLSRCGSHKRPRDGRASVRKRHRRRHPPPRERTTCSSSKCALPAHRRPPHHACIQQQQRLHLQPSLPVARCLAQPTKRGKRQCSRETPTPTPRSA